MGPLATPSVRVAVIGVGYLGKFHAAKYAALPGVQLVGVVDTDKRRAAAVAAEAGVPACFDYTDLFGRVDAVSVVTPTPTHYAVSRDFLNHGADVLIEKPISTTLAEADALIELATKRGRIVQVGLLERFNPAMQAARALIDQPRMLECRRQCIYKQRGTDVSVVLDLMIHDIDLALALAGAPLVQISANGLRLLSHYTDVARAHLAFANGCTADLYTSRIATSNERTLQIHQDNGYLALDLARHTIQQVGRDPSDGLANTTSGIGPGLALQQCHCPPGDALQQELASFIGAVRQRQTPLVCGHTGRQALEVALTIMDQIDARR